MKKLTPIKSIRAKCIDCCAGQLAEVRRCNINTCAIWPYRMGRRPTDSTPVSNPDCAKNPTLPAGFPQGVDLRKRGAQ